MLKRNKEALGLDIGAYATKAVYVKRVGGRTVIGGADTLSTGEEGILNEGELLQSVRQWIDKHGWGALNTSIALPQFMVTTMLRTFPTTGKSGALDSMVAYEIGQVAGLTEEALLHDYCRVGNDGGGNVNVFIGMCREKAAREKLAFLDSAGLKTDTLALGGMAVANAFLELHQNVGDDSKIRLVIDLGYENSTAVVLRGAQPLFTGVMMFSGSKFEQACAGDDRPASHRVKNVKDINLDEEIGHSTILLAAHLLENEIHGIVETWRAQASEDLSKAIVEEVCLCGGASGIKGLDRWLSERLETPVCVFGPECDGKVRPELTLAFGLALQAVGCAKCPLTIMPPDVREMRRRQRGLPYLAIALGVAVFCTVFLDVAWYLRLNGGLEEYERRLSGLQDCNELITRIEASYAELYSREACVMPLVAAGNQSERIKETIEAIGNACSEGDWFIYLADEQSYRAEDDKKGRQTANRGNMFGGREEVGEVAGQAEFPIKLNPGDVPVTLAYVAMSFSPNQDSQPYAPAKEIARKLDASGLFKGVDLMAEKDRAGRSEIFRAWLRFLAGVRGQYRSYSFILPFSDVDVRKDVIPAVKSARTRK
ncbi:MAG: pilus assembly protein PilM [Victivallales bacterium]|nr:pilus assembly protein PilM [Victivallales bacterium]